MKLLMNFCLMESLTRGFCLSTWMNPADTSELMWWEIVAGDRPMRSARSCPQRDSFLMSLMISSLRLSEIAFSLSQRYYETF